MVRPLKILFYFGHPAQYLFMRPVIRQLRSEGFGTVLAARTKDVLTTLLEADGESFHNLLPKGRKSTRRGILAGLLKREAALLKLVQQEKPDLMAGSDPSLAHIGRLTGIDVVTVTEDDFKVIPFLAWLTYPFTSAILAPAPCRAGPWEYKKSGYEGYMKLSYLHPEYFLPDRKKVRIDGPFVLVRLASLQAHHDFGVSGLQEEDVLSIIDMTEASGRKAVISSEGEVSSAFSQHLFQIVPSDMHHYLAAADLLISDSQSMSVEAAMLGTPSIRYSGFAGRINVLEELESRYGLTTGIRAGDRSALLDATRNLLQRIGLKEDYIARCNKMLSEKIQVGPFVAWYLSRFPCSRTIMREFPGFQYIAGRKSYSPNSFALHPVRVTALDFTTSKYRALLYALIRSGKPVLPFRDYLECRGDEAVILRHDVDDRPEKSLETARIQHALGIRSTFYFRVQPKSYNPGIIDAIASMGHEIGYHYEDMELALRERKKLYFIPGGIREEELYERAMELFIRHLEKIRRHYPVVTISMHGSPLSPFDNKSVWKKYDYRELGIIGEPYLDVDFSQVLYLTDTGRHWNGWRYSVRDKVSAKPGIDSFFPSPFRHTREIIRALEEGSFPARAMITFHPQRWTGNPLAWTRELLWQGAKNRVKGFVTRDA